MSAVSTTRNFDVSGTSRVPFGRLVHVELRKMADTRAGAWLLGVIAVITLVVVVVFYFTAGVENRTYFQFLRFTSTPLGFLLPVLGILLVTGEWGQRTLLTTFALEPSRMKVIAAKTIAALLYGVVAMLLAAVIAAAATAMGGADGAWAGDELTATVKMLLVMLLGVLQGVAFGLLVLNSAGAIVLFFVLPIAFNIATLWGWLAARAAWLDLATGQAPLLGFDPKTGAASPGWMTTEQWLQLGSVSLIWIVLPFVVGAIRVLRTEIK